MCYRLWVKVSLQVVIILSMLSNLSAIVKGKISCSEFLEDSLRLCTKKDCFSDQIRYGSACIFLPVVPDKNIAYLLTGWQNVFDLTITKEPAPEWHAAWSVGTTRKRAKTNIDQLATHRKCEMGKRKDSWLVR